MAFEMKPLNVFRLGSKKVVQCRVISGTPQDAINRSFCYRDGEQCVTILLTGLSTAWRQDNTFDFSFEGALEPPLAPSADAILEIVEC